MIVRLTHFKVPSNNTEEVKNIYNREVIPEVKRQKGNTTVMLLEPMDGSGEFISLTVWDSKANSDAYESSGIYRKLVDKLDGKISGSASLKVYSS